MSQQPQPQPKPRALTKPEIETLGRHAAQRAELEAQQHNDRVALQERQQAELAALMQPLVPPAPKGKRG